MFRFSFLVLFIIAILNVGCGSKKQPTLLAPNQPTIRIAVLDGRMAPGKQETRKVTVGSGFTSRTRYESGTANLVLADLIAEELKASPGVIVKSRLDLRDYMADKERLLARQYPSLSAAQRGELLASQSPLDYGRSMGVDYVIFPTVNKARLVQNRMLQSWMSAVLCEFEAYNVNTGERVWSWEGGRWKRFSSSYRVMQHIAEDVGDELAAAAVFSATPQTIDP
ncbi:MAG: hypothetical protein ACFCU1_13020 [Sumerlaeia bacterium]